VSYEAEIPALTLLADSLAELGMGSGPVSTLQGGAPGRGQESKPNAEDLPKASEPLHRGATLTPAKRPLGKHGAFQGPSFSTLV
jgi:hypothetical protein